MEAEKGVGNCNDYGARWYDASIGRFTTVDPLAEDYSFQSPYAYATNNPVLLRDIMGMGVEDLVVGGEDLKKKWKVFGEIQKLTNNKLQMDDNGKVTIVKGEFVNKDKNLSEGTELIEDLIGDNNTTTVFLGKRSVNYTAAVNPSSHHEFKNRPKAGKEYDANVYLTGASNSVNTDGTRGTSLFITAAHEFSHARDLVKARFDPSTFDTGVYDFDTGRTLYNFSKREYRTRVFENKIRSEQNVKLRALPIGSFFFTH